MEISTRPYIGSRDFYPDTMAFRNWMFSIQRDVCKKYGYREYNAPIVEPIGLYLAKSSQEIVSEQIYRFVDRGDREVAIRPEMTPTLARMVASKSNDWTYPLRWFSIGNFMRYERPGRGRLREFYQLNVDLIGSESPAADAEILSLAMDLMQSYGAKKEDYVLRFSDRRLLSLFINDVSPEKEREIGRLLDKKEKIGEEKFQEELKKTCEDSRCVDQVFQFLRITLDDLKQMEFEQEAHRQIITHMLQVESLLSKNATQSHFRFDPAIVRGFDYYTGLIFEINDTHPDNRRALFGGGRYDRLLGLFGGKDIPAVGFGMGDVTLENFLEIHGLIPSQKENEKGVYFTLMDESLLEKTMKIATELRSSGIEVELALEPSKKFKKQLQTAEKKGRRFVLIMGEDEDQNEMIKVRDLSSGEQSDQKQSDLVEYLTSVLGSI